MTNEGTTSDSTGSAHPVPQWSDWQRRCFIAVVMVLELALITGLVIGLIVLSRVFAGS